MLTRLVLEPESKHLHSFMPLRFFQELGELRESHFPCPRSFFGLPCLRVLQHPPLLILDGIYIYKSSMKGYTDYHRKFYLVFASMTAVMAVVAFLLFPEVLISIQVSQYANNFQTKNYSLEQIGQAFGDETADKTVHQDEVDVKSTGGAEEVDMV